MRGRSTEATDVDHDELAKHRRQVKRANSEVFELAKRRDVESLVALLGSPLETTNISVRFAALAHLGKLGDSNAIPHIMPLLADDDQAMRAGAIVALARLGARDAAPRVAALLRDPDPG